jgi:cytochrome c oxidase assembly protein Cox11
MDRKLSRRNLRTAYITTIVVVFMFGMSFVAAWLYNL